MERLGDETPNARRRGPPTRGTWAGVAVRVLLAVAFVGCAKAPPPFAPPAPPPLAPIAPIDTSQAPELLAEGTPLGDPVAAADEPLVTPDRSSPRALVSSLEAALRQSDRAALARLHVGLGAKPALDARDLDRAERDFLGARAGYWKRVLDALDRDTLLAVATPDALTASVPVVVGGALGSVTLRFERKGEAWLLRP